MAQTPNEFGPFLLVLTIRPRLRDLQAKPLFADPAHHRAVANLAVEALANRAVELPARPVGLARRFRIFKQIAQSWALASGIFRGRPGRGRSIRPSIPRALKRLTHSAIVSRCTLARSQTEA